MSRIEMKLFFILITLLYRLSTNPLHTDINTPFGRNNIMLLPYLCFKEMTDGLIKTQVKVGT